MKFIDFIQQLKLLVPGHASSVSSCQWLYIITFGGGLVEGDNVSVDVKVGEHCTVVVTTQASTKVCNFIIKYTDPCLLLCSRPQLNENS